MKTVEEAEQRALLMDPPASTKQSFISLLAKAVLKFSSCRYRNIDPAVRRDAVVMHRLTNFYNPLRYFSHFICSPTVIWMIYYLWPLQTHYCLQVPGYPCV